MPRIRLALARGEASSEGSTRKTGHIRTSLACERHWPQPLQERTTFAHLGGVPIQLQLGQVAEGCGYSPGGRSLGGPLPAGASKVGTAGRRFSTIRSASSPTTLPGLSRFCGSKICLISRKTPRDRHTGGGCRPFGSARRRVRRDRAAEAEDLFVEIVGQAAHLGDVVGDAKVQERFDPHLPLSGVARHRRGDLVPP